MIYLLRPSQIRRLARLGKILCPISISILIDHSSQLDAFFAFKEGAGFEVEKYIKLIQTIIEQVLL